MRDTIDQAVGVIAVVLLSLTATAVADDEAPAGEAPREISYWNDVRPILQKNCQGCHQPAKRGGKLVLTGFDELIAGGRSQEDEPIVNTEAPDESLLIVEVTSQDGEPPSMPKDADPLSDAAVDTLRQWIAQGAKDDTPPSARAPAVSMESPPVYESPPVLTSLDFSPDGALLAVSGYHEVLLYRADGSGIAARLVGLSERVEAARFSPDGSSLAVTGGSPGRFGEVQVWDVERRRLRVSKMVTYDTLYGGQWSPSGELIAFGCGDNSVRAIDASSGEQVLFQGAHSDWVLDATFSKDSSHLISIGRDRTAKLIVVETEQFVDNITSITPGALKGGLIAVDLRPEKDEILVGGADGAPKLYKIFREQARKIGDDYNLIRAFEEMPGRVYSLAFDADGGRFVAGSSLDTTGEVRLVSTEDGKVLWKLPFDEAIYAVAISPDGKTVAAGGYNGTVHLVDAEKGEIVKSFVSVPVSL